MSFSDEMKKIGEGISASYDARIGTLEDIYKDTQSTLKNARGMVKDFHGERMHMSEELRSDLEHFVNELRKTTKSMLNEFDKEHKEMANELRMDLAKVPKMLKDFMDNFLKAANQFHNMLASYYKEEIKQPTQKMLSDLRREYDRAHEAWISITRSMGSARGMKQAPKKMTSKAEQICSILEGHPKGMTPGQIAKGMGCTPQSIRTPMMGLKKQGRISKKQNKYFFKG